MEAEGRLIGGLGAEPPGKKQHNKNKQDTTQVSPIFSADVVQMLSPMLVSLVTGLDLDQTRQC